MIPYNDARHERRDSPATIADLSREAMGQCCAEDCAACTHNTIAGLASRNIPVPIIRGWSRRERVEAIEWARVVFSGGVEAPEPPHVRGARLGPECTCGGHGLCGGCYRPGHTARVDLSDAYGHAIAGNHEMGVVVALIGIVQQLAGIEAAILKLSPPHDAARLNLTATVTDKEGNPVATITQQVDPSLNDLAFSLSPVDSNGNPITLPSAPTWTSSQPSVVALEVAADGLSAKGRVNAVGVCTVTVTDGHSTDECQVLAAGSPPPGPGPLNLAVSLIGKGE